MKVTSPKLPVCSTAQADKTPSRLRRFSRDEAGAVTTEWVLVAAVVVGLCLATMIAVAQQTRNVVDVTGAAMAKAVEDEVEPTTSENSPDEDGGESSGGAPEGTAWGGNSGASSGGSGPSMPTENKFTNDTSAQGGGGEEIVVNVNTGGGGAAGGGDGGGGGGGSGSADGDGGVNGDGDAGADSGPGSLQ